VHVSAAQDQVEHDVLELAAGWRGAGGDDLGEPGSALPSSVAREGVGELAHVDAVERLGAPGGRAERAVVESGREVEEGAGR
jgi:hypothetical protein